MKVWSRTTLKSLAVPGGVFLLGVAVLIEFGWLTLPLPALSFLHDCALIGGMLLAWRFHSSRTLSAILVLFLAEQAIRLSGGAPATPGIPVWSVPTAVAALVPLNFLLIALLHERGFTISGIAPFGLFLFVQAVIVAVLSSSVNEASRPSPAHHLAANFWLTEPVLLAFGVAELMLLARTLASRKPVDSALFWSLGSFFLSLYYNSSARFRTVYSTTAMCILATSIIETSYLLAYHDELTTLPSRRAFNDALHRLQDPFSIAAIDIDHFKRFNDTYGHNTGDQVLRLVATRLGRVTGGGQAYRCGGEEFVILFPGKTTQEVVGHLERLRAAIEAAEFRQRENDRRRVPRGPDRRNVRPPGRGRKGQAIRQLTREKTAVPLSVTVSIGVASSFPGKPSPDSVVARADKALYRAKANGRNRLETDAPLRRRSDPAKTAGIA